jgi:hypothetical protein
VLDALCPARSTLLFPQLEPRHAPRPSPGSTTPNTRDQRLRPTLSRAYPSSEVAGSRAQKIRHKPRDESEPTSRRRSGPAVVDFRRVERRLSVYCAYTGLRPLGSDGVRSRFQIGQKWLIFRDPSGHHRTTQDVMNGLSRRRPRVQVPSTPLKSFIFSVVFAGRPKPTPEAVSISWRNYLSAFWSSQTRRRLRVQVAEIVLPPRVRINGVLRNCTGREGPTRRSAFQVGPRTQTQRLHLRATMLTAPSFCSEGRMDRDRLYPQAPRSVRG